MDPARQHAVERQLGTRIRRTTRLGGGDHAAAYRLDSTDGPAFCKLGPPAAPEIAGLAALRACDALVVPEVLGHGQDWLALEWLEPTARTPGALGAAMARLHSDTRPTHGFPCSTSCGPTALDNRERSDWPGFFVDQRLLPVLHGAADRRTWPAALRHEVEGWIASWRHRLPDGPASLLHGDLWSGNHLPTARGPAVFDPAAYWGHREAELGMIALFGDFTPADLDAYQATMPLESGWRDRLGVYVLFHLLNHDLIFGGYRDRCVALCRAGTYPWQ